MDLVSVIAGARVHLGGDSGALHLAVMAGVPTVSWFRRYDGMCDWMPNCSTSHRVLIGTCNGPLGMRDISATQLVLAMNEVAPQQ
jgi:ADP-heptose:LPS heptosyltransferase